MPGVEERLQARLSALIALPSVSCVAPALDMSNASVTDTLSNWFEDAGFAVTRQTVAPKPEKYNLLARAGGGTGGFVPAGHTDTVPYDETVVFGPGDINTAHQPNEWVAVDKALRMGGILRMLIERFCCDD